MYDAQGRYVAKYHKYNLFNSEFSLFNIDKEEQNVFVNTEFGNNLLFISIIPKRHQIFSSIFPNIYIIGFESIFLGRLGLIICEDLLWEYPTVDLVRTNNVDTIIFPTEWWDEYPHQLPHVDQASWAKSLQVLFHYT